jgi:hypothetical protein
MQGDLIQLAGFQNVDDGNILSHNSTVQQGSRAECEQIVSAVTQVPANLILSIAALLLLIRLPCQLATRDEPTMA